MSGRRRGAHGDDVGAEGAEEFGPELVSGAVGAIENDAEACELRPGNEAAAKKSKIFSVEEIHRREVLDYFLAGLRSDV